MDEGISTEIWILDSIDHLARAEYGCAVDSVEKGGWGRPRREKGKREAERTGGAVESFSERIKARERDRLVRRVTKG